MTIRIPDDFAGPEPCPTCGKEMLESALDSHLFCTEHGTPPEPLDEADVEEHR